MTVPIRASGTCRGSRACDALTHRRRRREAKLVVVAAGEQAIERKLTLRPGELRLQRRRPRHARDIDDGARRSDASRMWARSPVRPSETSSIALATPRSDCPSARAARDARACAALRQVRVADNVVRRWSTRECEHRVAERSRHPHVVARRVAPLRRIAWPIGTSPAIVRHRLRGPRVVSPPISATPCASASANSPRENASSHEASLSRQRAGEQRPARPRAHRREVRKVHGEHLVPERFGIGIGEEVARLDHHVDGQHELVIRRATRTTPRRRQRRRRRPGRAAGDRSTARSARTR